MRSRKEVAEAILEMTYLEMREMAIELVSSTKEDDPEFDKFSIEAWSEKLYWWAQSISDAAEADKK